MLPVTEGFANESDVEQKFVFPFLCAPQPTGLGFPTSSIKTKPNIKRFLIGKGNEQKLYYPDYLIVLLGFPLMVVEAKGPGEDLETAYREARLYANELNATFLRVLTRCDTQRLRTGADCGRDLLIATLRHLTWQ